jgi:hypothetical protein
MKRFPHVPGASLAKEASPRARGQYTQYGLVHAGAASCRQRRQPSAEPGSAGREPKAARDVREVTQQ